MPPKYWNVGYVSDQGTSQISRLYIAPLTSLNLINVTESSRISLPEDMQRVSKAIVSLTSRAHYESNVKCSVQARLKLGLFLSLGGQGERRIRVW